MSNKTRSSSASSRRKIVLTGSASRSYPLIAIAVFLIGRARRLPTRMPEGASKPRPRRKPWFVVCLGGVVLAYAGYIAAYRATSRRVVRRTESCRSGR
jgi:hypothetical protein